MPVINVKKDGVWQDIASTYKHAHTVSDITDLPASFADDIESLKDKVGADSVAYQINTAIQANEYVHPFTHPADMITGLSDVAISGDYNDLSNLPEIPEEYVHPENHDASMITGLATVATSGSYNDLSDKPAIPSIAGLATKTYVDEQIASVGGNGGSGGTLEQVQVDWDETDTTSPAYIKNKPTITGGGASVQANWNQNDESAADFIKNKPFGETNINASLIDGSYKIAYYADFESWQSELIPATSDVHLTEGNTYTVIFNGVEYQCECFVAQGIVPAIGNGVYFGGEDTGEPFVIMEDATGNLSGTGSPCFMYDLMDYPDQTVTTEVTYDIKLTYNGTDIQHIDNKYLPEHLQFGENGTGMSVTLIDGQYTGEEVIPNTSDVHLTEGNTYTVIFNGVEYQCECFVAQGIVPAIGNAYNLGGENTGEPFVIVEDATGNLSGTGSPCFMCIGVIEEGKTYFDVEVTYGGSSIKYLDNKYLDFITLQPAQEIMPEQNMTFTLGRENTNNPEESIFQTENFDLNSELVVGNKYTVVWDGEKYDCVCNTMDGMHYLGNLFVANNSLSNSGEPFLLSPVYQGEDAIVGYVFMTLHTSNDESFECSVSIGTVPKYVIKNEFIPDDIGGGSSLPEVTTEDNDKVMTVVDGVWTAQTPASGLPEVTTSDAGKFLRVSSAGTWIVEAIQDVSEVGA